MVLEILIVLLKILIAVGVAFVARIAIGAIRDIKDGINNIK